MKEIILGFIQLIVDFIIYIIPQKRPSNEQLANAKIVAHRGWHNNQDILENTDKSFECALDHQLWGIEFDIRWTKDLVPIIHHDSSLKRLWNYNKNISEITFQDLRQMAPEVPSLEEVISKYGKKIHFFIELKSEFFPDLSKQKEILQSLLSNLVPIEDFHLIGLDTATLQLFDLYDPKAYLLVGQTNISQMSEEAIEFKCAGVMGHFLLCTNELIKKHRSADQKIGTGFSRSKNCMYREINRGIDWIFTNHPWFLL